MTLACRRTTFEWVLRRAVLAEPGMLELRDGVAVEGLLAEPGRRRHPGGHGRGHDDGPVPTPTSSSWPADGDRRFPDWLAAIGADPVPEEVEDTGIVYFSRFYRLVDGAEPPPQTARSAATSAT